MTVTDDRTESRKTGQQLDEVTRRLWATIADLRTAIDDQRSEGGDRGQEPR